MAVTFTDTSPGTPSAWLWDFGDGETSTEQNPVHTYAVDGTYTVVLTAYYGDKTTTCSADVIAYNDVVDPGWFTYFTAAADMTYFDAYGAFAIGGGLQPDNRSGVDVQPNGFSFEVTGVNNQQFNVMGDPSINPASIQCYEFRLNQKFFDESPYGDVSIGYFGGDIGTRNLSRPLGTNTGNDATVYYAGSGAIYGPGFPGQYGDTWGLNDIIGVVIDTGVEVRFFKNGVFQAGTGVSGPYGYTMMGIGYSS